MVNLESIKRAKENIKDTVLETSISFAPNLSRYCESEIYFKKENLQLTGSFKIRGAFNKITSLSKEKRDRGVVTASAGNHAQGVAYSSNHYNIPSTIFMPEATPLTKVNGVREYGSEVVLYGTNYDEAYTKAIEFAKDKNLEFIHPFADDDVISGQGTIALEIFEQIKDLEMIFVPIGGGGLIAGISTAIKEINTLYNRNIKVIGVSAAGAPAMRESYINKKPINTDSVRTIADGIAVKNTSELTLDYILRQVDDIVEVSDEEIANAILFLLEKQKLVVEGAGSVGVAAMLHNKIDIRGKKVATVLSGGNIDVTMLSVIIEKGLLKSQRKMKLKVTLIDKPGALMQLTELFKESNANIVHIGYDRTSTSIAYGDANVIIALETKGSEHQILIESNLKKAGFYFENLS
jgi:threonine dehydratase